MKARVVIMPRAEALDPQGRAVNMSLKHLGFDVQDCRIGKVVVLDIKANDKEVAKAQVSKMCEKLLANPLIESYEVEIP